MVFSSSPELEDGQDSNGVAGSTLIIGGKNHDAERLAQLEALKAAQSDEVAARQRAIEDGAREYAAQRTSLQEQREELARKRQIQHEQAQTYACSFVIFGVVGVLFYLCYDSVKTPHCRETLQGRL